MDIYKNARKACLLLEDGSLIQGYSVGSTEDAYGELVFNTSVVGFQQLLTDPANENNILVDTFPMLGNYGVVEGEDDLSACHAAAVVVRDWCPTPSNYRSTGSIDQWLEQKGITGLFGVDTRALTRKLRDGGVMKALITCKEVNDSNKEEFLEKIRDHQDKTPYWKNKNELEISPVSGKKALIYDLGARADVIAALNARGFSTIAVPAAMSAEEILSQEPDCIVICGGWAGDWDLSTEKKTIAELEKSGVPMLGIGLGHQMMAELAGGKVEKMKVGHRGANCPVTELSSGRTFITTQNHGYVVASVCSSKAQITHVNSNDKSCEGLRYLDFPGMSVQFVPESETGRKNFDHVYETFLNLLEK